MTETFQDYLRIKEAARLIGVSEATLRNWSKQGKIKVHRNPVNAYRLFLRRDLEDVLLALKRSATQGPRKTMPGQKRNG